jgi:hypothetical protein
MAANTVDDGKQGTAAQPVDPAIRYSLFVPSASQVGTYVPAKEAMATTGEELHTFELYADA